MYDSVIIGSGPAGLSAAIYASRAMLHAVVVEREPMGVGQIAESGGVDNYPGLPDCTGYELGERMRAHAVSLGADIREGNVIQLAPTSDGWRIFLEHGEQWESRTVIYAAGASPRRLEIPGEERLRGHGVSYCAVCDGAFYRNRTVAVVGGGDSALSEALLLAKQAEIVYLLHRRTALRASALLQEQVRRCAKIHTLLEAVPREIEGERRVTALRYQQAGENRRMTVDGVFVAIGSEPNTKLLDGLVSLDAQGYVPADESGATETAGLFVAGDVRTKPLRQLVTAASDGAVCVHSVQTWLTERENRADSGTVQGRNR